MSIGYVGKAFVLSAASGTSIAVPMPSGVVAGNKLYVLIGSVASTATAMTAPAGGGFNLVKEVTTGTNLRVQLYSKTAVSTDAGATFTWTTGNSGRFFGYSVAYSGVDVAAPELADAVDSTTAGTGPWTTPALSLSDGDWLLTAAVGRENPGTASAKDWSTSDSSDVERFDNATATSGTSIMISAALLDSNRALVAGTASRAFTVTASLSSSQVWAVRIPAPVVVSPTGGNPWSEVGFDEGVRASNGLSVGPDSALTTAQTFTRTATEPTGTTITARKWEIVSGPLGTGMQISSAAAVSWKPGSSVSGSVDIRNPTFQELAYEITSTAENSTLNWASKYNYIEDIHDNRGYTAGLSGFTSASGDMLQLVQQYTVESPNNPLASFISGLQACVKVGFTTGASAAAASNLGTAYITAWQNAAANDPVFRKVQRDFRKRLYWDDALVQALADGVGPLGLAIYYDVLVNHGVGTDPQSFGGLLAAVRAANTKPAAGGNETTWLNSLIDKRNAVLVTWGDTQQQTTGRVAAHKLLVNGGTVSGATQTPKLTLAPPFKWTMYGDPYSITALPDPAADALLGSYVLRYTATPVGTADVTVTVA